MADISKIQLPDGTSYSLKDSTARTIAYRVRLNESQRPVREICDTNMLCLSSPDSTKWIPISSGSIYNNLVLTSLPFDPFGPIIYYNGSTQVSANSLIPETNQYIIYDNVNFNNCFKTIADTNSPVFLKCTPQTNGTAILSSSVSSLITTELPSTDDGKIYIYLGQMATYNTIQITNNHPVYYHDGTGIRLWMGTTISSGGGDGYQLVSTSDGNGNVVLSVSGLVDGNNMNF